MPHTFDVIGKVELTSPSEASTEEQAFWEFVHYYNNYPDRIVSASGTIYTFSGFCDRCKKPILSFFTMGNVYDPDEREKKWHKNCATIEYLLEIRKGKTFYKQWYKQMAAREKKKLERKFRDTVPNDAELKKRKPWWKFWKR